MENLPESPNRRNAILGFARTNWPLLAGGILFLGAIFLVAFSNTAPTEPANDFIETQIANALASATPRPAFSAEVYEAILPSLVFIQTTHARAAEAGSQAESDIGFGVGSGVVVNENGEVLTSLHVVAGAQVIEIIFADGTKVEAEIAGADPTQDIALLTPEQLPELLVPAVLGDPFAMRIGDEAFAVGNPFGLPGSMSTGVISGFDRTLPVSETQVLEGLIINHF